MAATIEWDQRNSPIWTSHTALTLDSGMRCQTIQSRLMAGDKCRYRGTACSQKAINTQRVDTMDQRLSSLAKVWHFMEDTKSRSFITATCSIKTYMPWQTHKRILGYTSEWQSIRVELWRSPYIQICWLLTSSHVSAKQPKCTHRHLK